MVAASQTIDYDRHRLPVCSCVRLQQQHHVMPATGSCRDEGCDKAAINDTRSESIKASGLFIAALWRLSSHRHVDSHSSTACTDYWIRCPLGNRAVNYLYCFTVIWSPWRWHNCYWYLWHDCRLVLACSQCCVLQCCNSSRAASKKGGAMESVL